jgi:hypothetical protein
MSDAEEALRRVDTLIGVGLRLALSTTTGRMALAKAAPHIDEGWLGGRWSDSVGGALRRATESAPEPLSFSTVEGLLREAWGVRKLTGELDSLDREPVAVRVASQVHRGVHAGKPVAVKLLRPGLAGAVRQDLALLDTLLSPLSSAFPGLDPGALVAEGRERVMDEFDFENEAQLMRRFSRALRGGGPVVVPSPVSELCRETVLVASWLEGTPLTESLAGGVGLGHDPTAAALLQFVIGGIREGLVHCDLDLDDVLMLEDGRLGVVDFGAVAVIDRARADAGLALVRAFIAGDATGLDAALAAAGLLTPGHGELALSVASEVLGELGGPEPSRLDIAAVSALARRVGLLSPEDGVALLQAGRMVPADLYLGRALGQLFSVIARIGASGIWREQVAVALRDGWSESTPGL